MSHNNLKVVIPARYSSSRLPGKPLVTIAGKPLIAWTFENASQALPRSEIVVAIDDERVALELKRRNIPYVMTSPFHSSGTDRIAEVTRIKAWDDGFLVLNIQGDEPLVSRHMLRCFVDFCYSKPNLNLATIASTINDHSMLSNPNIVKVVLSKESRGIYFSRHPIPYFRDEPLESWPFHEFLRHIGIYAYRCSALKKITSSPACALEQFEKLEQLRALWLGIAWDVMQWEQGSPHHGVDTPEDVSRISCLLEKGTFNES